MRHFIAAPASLPTGRLTAPLPLHGIASVDLADGVSDDAARLLHARQASWIRDPQEPRSAVRSLYLLAQDIRPSSEPPDDYKPLMRAMQELADARVRVTYDGGVVMSTYLLETVTRAGRDPVTGLDGYGLHLGAWLREALSRAVIRRLSWWALRPEEERTARRLWCHLGSGLWIPDLVGREKNEDQWLSLDEQLAAVLDVPYDHLLSARVRRAMRALAGIDARFAAGRWSVQEVGQGDVLWVTRPTVDGWNQLRDHHALALRSLRDGVL